MPDHPNVRRFLDLSTAHLSPAARGYLSESGTANHAASYHGAGAGAAIGCLGATLYGWFMHAPEPMDEGGIDNGLPDDFVPVIRFARSIGCDYILFDADADTIEGLEVFDDE